MEGLNLLFFFDMDLQTLQWHPISGIPEEAPVPKKTKKDFTYRLLFLGYYKCEIKEKAIENF
jgi:hypothetical protein